MVPSQCGPNLPLDSVDVGCYVQNLETCGVDILDLKLLRIMMQLVDMTTQRPNLISGESNKVAAKTLRTARVREHRGQRRLPNLVSTFEYKQLASFHHHLHYQHGEQLPTKL